MGRMGNTFIHRRPRFSRAAFLGAVLGASFFVSPTPAAAAAAGVEDVVRRNEPAAVVVMGEKPDGGTVQGSGCFVHSSGIVLTSLHQVDGLGNLHVIGSDNARYAATVLASDPARDLALLKTDAKPQRWAWIGDTTGLKSGAAIIAIAAPQNLQFSTVTGIVSNPDRTYKGMRVMQCDLPAEPGSSGGPVFDSDGALIGCIIGRLENQQWVTVINPINNAYTLLDANGVPVPGRRLSNTILDESEIVPEPGIPKIHRQAIEVYNRGVAANSASEKVDAYGTAVKLLPDFYEAWFNLAVASAAANQPTKAITAYRIAERLRPDAVEVPHNLGRVFLALSRYDDAAACFGKAVKLTPGSASAQNDLGEAYRRMSPGPRARVHPGPVQPRPDLRRRGRHGRGGETFARLPGCRPERGRRRAGQDVAGTVRGEVTMRGRCRA
jgi:hypothetical protein